MRSHQRGCDWNAWRHAACSRRSAFRLLPPVAPPSLAAVPGEFYRIGGHQVAQRQCRMPSGMRPRCRAQIRFSRRISFPQGSAIRPLRLRFQAILRFTTGSASRSSRAIRLTNNLPLRPGSAIQCPCTTSSDPAIRRTRLPYSPDSTLDAPTGLPIPADVVPMQGCQPDMSFRYDLRCCDVAESTIYR